MSYDVKDSGKRQEFASGMVRDVTEGKIEYSRVMSGPMFERWAAHLEKGAQKYPDVAPGTANWTLAADEEEYQRFRASAFRHFIQWFNGEADEDHAAAVFFNINGACYVANKMSEEDNSLVDEDSNDCCTGCGKDDCWYTDEDQILRCRTTGRRVTLCNSM